MNNTRSDEDRAAEHEAAVEYLRERIFEAAQDVVDELHAYQAGTAQLLAEHGHQAERIAELVGQVEAQAGEIAELRAGKELLRNEVAEFQNLRADALALADKWDSEWPQYPVVDIGKAAAAAVRLCARELRAALGAADEPTTGGSDD